MAAARRLGEARAAAVCALGAVQLRAWGRFVVVYLVGGLVAWVGGWVVGNTPQPTLLLPRRVPDTSCAALPHSRPSSALLLPALLPVPQTALNIPYDRTADCRTRVTTGSYVRKPFHGASFAGTPIKTGTYVRSRALVHQLGMPPRPEQLQGPEEAEGAGAGGAGARRGGGEARAGAQAFCLLASTPKE